MVDREFAVALCPQIASTVGTGYTPSGTAIAHGGAFVLLLTEWVEDMKVIREHLLLRNPRFLCSDVAEARCLIVPVSSVAGAPATAIELQQLQRVANGEYAALEPLYRRFNGVVFHENGETAGLVVATVDEIEELNDEWHAWFEDCEPDDLFDFQRDGLAFASIASSGNYFVVHGGQVFYSDHDGGDDAVWGDSVKDFFRRALADPPKFLCDAGCYTRYSDGKSAAQFIPESFSHD